MQHLDIVIIGGGLSGLTTAYFLEKEGFAPTVIEARNRLGGRIYTSRQKDEAALEMGATWLGKKHKHLTSLLDELDIPIFEQYMGKNAYYEPISTSPPQLVQLPQNEDPTFRIAGGSDRLIKTLEQKLTKSTIIVGQAVISIRKKGKTLEVKTQDNLIKADLVISTLPPKLFIDTISVTPALPKALAKKAKQTHTWMGESIKVALTYENPFWRNENTSGTIMSNVGPVTEMYDHSNEEASRFALKGFMNDSYHTLTKEDRLVLILEQLQKFYGDKATDFNSYRESVWKDQQYTYQDYEQHIIPHQHNGDAIFRETYLDNRLLISGAETATNFPGYMDGAVESAHRVVQTVVENFG
jgi:monoamine oxidase